MSIRTFNPNPHNEIETRQTFQQIRRQLPPDRMDATDAPTPTADTYLKGFQIGSRWFDVTNHDMYICTDSGESTGTATWRKMAEFQVSTGGVVAGGGVAPLVDNAIVRNDGTRGNLQGSVVTIDDAGVMSGASIAAAGGWQDDGTVVRLITTTDEVVIGGSAALSSAKTSIDGDADQIQLIIQGHSTQTSSLLVLENSAGTDLITVSGAGHMAFTAAQEIRLREASQRIYSSATLTLDLDADSTINFRLTGSVVGKFETDGFVLPDGNSLKWGTGTANIMGTTAGDAITVDAATITLFGKTIIDGLEINDSADDHQYVLAVSNLAADRTVTLPLLTGNDTFVFADHAQTLTNKSIAVTQLTGQVTVAQGGTGLSTIADASILVTNATDVLSVLTPAAGQSIRVTGAGGSWEAYTPGGGHTIRENGTDQTARTGLNFIDADAGAGLITDDAVGDETEVNLTLYVLASGARPITTPQINDTSADHQYVFAVSELTADRTVTLPLLTGADTFVFESHTQTLSNKTFAATCLVTPANEATDTTCFPLFTTAATGAVAVKTNATDLKFNSNTGLLTVRGLTIGIAAVGVDYALTFDGETNDGVLTWMEDEDYFQFADHVLLTDSKALYLGATTNSLIGVGGNVTLVAGTLLTLGSAGTIGLGDGTLRLMQPNTTRKISLGSGSNLFEDAFFAGQLLLAANGAPTLSPLQIQQSAAPTSPVDGDIWHDSTLNTTAAFVSGMKSYLVGLTYSQVTSKAVASTAAETTLVDSTSAIGTNTFAANYLQVGKSIRLRASGVYGTTGSPTLQLRLRWGAAGSGTVLLDTGAQTVTGATARTWAIDVILTARTTASLMGQGHVRLNTTSAILSALWEFSTGSAGVASLATTATALTLSAQWSASSASNTITCTNMTMEVVG